MEHSKIVDQRRIEIERRMAEDAKALENLSSELVNQKFQRRTELLAEVKVIESELSAILGISAEELFGTGKPAKASPLARPSKTTTVAARGERRKSLTENEKLVKIAELLRGLQKGLSAKEIADRIGDTYNTVSAHLSRHTNRYTKSGKKRGTVYLLVE